MLQTKTANQTLSSLSQGGPSLPTGSPLYSLWCVRTWGVWGEENLEERLPGMAPLA